MPIENEVLRLPAAAIEHPHDQTPLGVREYLEEFDYWTFGRSADEILRAARQSDGGEALRSTALAEGNL